MGGPTRKARHPSREGGSGLKAGSRGTYTLAWFRGAYRGICGTPRLFGTLARVPGVVVVQETRAALHVKVEPAAVRSVLDLMGAYRPEQEARRLEADRRQASIKAARRQSRPSARAVSCAS
jgi:hypothetical protein